MSVLRKHGTTFFILGLIGVLTAVGFLGIQLGKYRLNSSGPVSNIIAGVAECIFAVVIIGAAFYSRNLRRRHMRAENESPVSQSKPSGLFPRPVPSISFNPSGFLIGMIAFILLVIYALARLKYGRPIGWFFGNP